MNALPDTLIWQPGDLGIAIERLDLINAVSGGRAPAISTPDSVQSALEAALAGSGIAPVPLSVQHDDIGRCIEASVPMVVPVNGGACAVIVTRAGRRTATLLAGDGGRRRIPMATLVTELEVPLSEELEETIAGLDRDVDPVTARAVRRQHQSRQVLFAGWRLPVGSGADASFWQRDTISGVIGLIGVHLLHFGLWILSWSLLVGAMLGVGERESLLALWMLALLSSLLLLPVESLLQQKLSTRLGIAIKQGLLASALTLDRKAVRDQGIGRLTARALEANRLETLATQGGLRMLLCAIDALAVLAVFLWYVGPHFLLLLFVFTILLAAARWRSYYRAEERVLDAQLRLTAVHTEELIGHRTRKAFVGRAAWHTREEACLADYDRACSTADRVELGAGAIPRLWAATGMAVILFDLFGQNTTTLTSVALIGFVIVGFGILQSASVAVQKLLRAAVAYRIIPSGERGRDAATNGLASMPGPAGGTRFLVHGLDYAYPDSPRPVLADLDLEIDAAGKILLTGESGSGKSTLGALLGGHLKPGTGSILSGGVDQHLTGVRRWLQQVCYIPQPGSNHVLTDTFAFNLLLGRSWPPTADDLEEAQSVARRLGLGPLIDRMPAGMMQMVGEGGWRLSQGEQARLFLARGILQGAELLIADELLGPLDPLTRLEVVEAVEALPNQLILVEHG